MTLTPEQITELKNQLKSQVSSLPEDQKSEALQQIDALSEQALEEMLKQQKAQSNTEGNIFRNLINKKIPSTIIEENSEALAVLSLLSISKGHTIIIPKSPIDSPEKIPKTLFNLAKSLSDKIIKNLKAKSVKLHTEVQFGEAIINLIPIYDSDLDINSPREQQSPESLSETKKEIETIYISTKKPSETPEISKPKKPSETPEISKPKKPSSSKQKVPKLQRKIP